MAVLTVLAAMVTIVAVGFVVRASVVMGPFALLSIMFMLFHFIQTFPVASRSLLNRIGSPVSR